MLVNDLVQNLPGHYEVRVRLRQCCAELHFGTVWGRNRFAHPV